MIRFLRWLALLGGSFYLICGLLLSMRDAHPQNSYLIAFQSNRAGKWDIFTMLADGSNVRRITHDDAVNTNPQWSPDGQWIAYETLRDGVSDIVVMRPNGSQRRVITDGLGSSILPTWSPDSQSIAFSVQTTNRRAYPYVVAVDSGQLQRLPIPYRITYFDYSIVWSPDGEWLVFAVLEPGGTNTLNLHHVRSNGTDDTVILSLTSNAPRAFRLRYSWDQQRFIYSLLAQGDVSVDADGNDAQVIPRGIARDVRWAAGGRYALYEASSGRQVDIWQVEPRHPCQSSETCLHLLDYARAINLTEHPSQNQNPTWSPLIDKPWRWQGALVAVLVIAGSFPLMRVSFKN